MIIAGSKKPPELPLQKNKKGYLDKCNFETMENILIKDRID